MKKNNKWDLRFLELAKFISNWSKDPSTKVGSVIIDDKKRIVGTGYNGLPMGIYNEESVLSNREEKYEKIIHGEINCILNSNKSCQNCTLYVWPFMPCSRCASIIIQSGIKRVVCPVNNNERWINSFNMTRDLFKEANVELCELGEFYEKS